MGQISRGKGEMRETQKETNTDMRILIDREDMSREGEGEGEIKREGEPKKERGGERERERGNLIIQSWSQQCIFFAAISSSCLSLSSCNSCG